MLGDLPERYCRTIPTYHCNSKKRFHLKDTTTNSIKTMHISSLINTDLGTLNGSSLILHDDHLSMSIILFTSFQNLHAPISC